MPQVLYFTRTKRIETLNIVLTQMCNGFGGVVSRDGLGLGRIGAPFQFQCFQFIFTIYIIQMNSTKKTLVGKTKRSKARNEWSPKVTKFL